MKKPVKKPVNLSLFDAVEALLKKHDKSEEEGDLDCDDENERADLLDAWVREKYEKKQKGGV